MSTWTDTTLSDAERAEALLADMLLDEKIAQFGSFWELPTGNDGTEEGADAVDSPSGKAASTTGGGADG